MRNLEDNVRHRRGRSCGGVLVVLALVGGPAVVRAQEPAAAPAAGSASTVPVTGAAVTRDQDGKVTMRAVRLDVPLTLDGRLDERLYESVPAASDFIQQEPRPREPATEKTEVWVFFDDANIYVAGRCWDSHPELEVANDMRRDGTNVFQNEHVVVTFDTFHDRRTGFYFQTSPLGALRDGLISDQRSTNFDWNGVWRTRSRRDDKGWTFEMQIPFKTIRYPGGGEQVWGVNFRRTVRWKNESSFLSFVGPQWGLNGAFRMSDSATLVGLEAPARSRNIEVKPYVTGGTMTDVRATPPLSNDLTRDVGVDMKYSLTRGLIADVTVNTDFAQVEVDDQQVNLTRASLLFPEKREFFLEGQSVFRFASVASGALPAGTNVGGDAGNATALTPTMFFSRRIGLESGVPVPLNAGARVAGRAGKYQLGLINIQTGTTERAPAVESTNFSVVRVTRDLGRSSFGVLGANRSRLPNGDGDNQLYGADMNLFLFRNVTVTSYYAMSRKPGVTKDRASYLGRFDWGHDRYGLNFERLSVGENFSPEMSFVPRRAFRRTYGYARFSPRFTNGRVRKYSWQASLDYITDPQNRLQSREGLASFRTDWNSGDQWLFEYKRNAEHLTEQANFGGAIVRPGSYAFQEVRTAYGFGPARFFFGKVEFNQGTYYDGNRTIATVNGRLNTGARLGIEPRLSINWIDVSTGKVVAKVISTRTTFSMTPRMFVAALVQYNSTNSSLTSNVRFRWEYIPGSEFFIVYSDGYDTRPASGMLLDNRTFAVKFTRMVRW